MAITSEDKECLLGGCFRAIDVLGIEFEDGVQLTEIVLNGRRVVLVGDPEEALRTYLAETQVEGIDYA